MSGPSQVPSPSTPLLSTKRKPKASGKMAARAISSLPIPTSPLLPARSPNAAARSSLSVTPRRASSFLGCRLSLPPSPRLHRPCCPHPAAASVLSMLPTANPERASSVTNTKWSSRAIKSFGMAELEARKLKYPTTGTEALLMGILVEGTSQAAQFLRANGITLFKVREETVKLLGKSDMYFFSPEHPSLTEPAQKALDWAVDEKLKSGEDGEITVAYMLLGIWAQEDSAGHKILASLGFDDDKAKELAKSASKDIVMNYR